MCVCLYHWLGFHGNEGEAKYDVAIGHCKRLGHCSVHTHHSLALGQLQILFKKGSDTQKD